MHKGHKYAIMEAAARCHELTVVICIDYQHDPLYPSPSDRIAVVEKEFEGLLNIKVDSVDCTAFPYAKEDDVDVSKYWANWIYETYPETGTIFGSEHYVKYMADNYPACNGIRYKILDIDRKTFPVSATMIRENSYENFEYLVESAKPLYTKHVLVVGSESCGKSTLVKNLSKLMKAPFVPEMYRSMFPEKGMDFTPYDLLDVAKVQNQASLSQTLSPMNKGLVIHDTCNDVTWLYGNEYYPEHKVLSQVLEEKGKNECKFDLILFCDIDVPWEQDGTRTLGGEYQRKEMRDKFFALAAKKSRENNCELVILPPDYKRLPSALEVIEKLIK